MAHSFILQTQRFFCYCTHSYLCNAAGCLILGVACSYYVLYRAIRKSDRLFFCECWRKTNTAFALSSIRTGFAGLFVRYQTSTLIFQPFSAQALTSPLTLLWAVFR